ncbi:hypothetical protein BH10ACT3_BH10ACT3_15020 [soil metagenome]
MTEAAEISVGGRYRSSRLRLTEVLGQLDESSWELPVAACPGWSVRDVLAHLVGIIEDAAAGRINGPPGPAQTAAEVERHRSTPPSELLQSWSALAPTFESAISAGNRWPAALDVLSHEHDIRTAVGQPGDRQHDDVLHAASILVRGLPDQVTVDIEDGPTAARIEPGHAHLSTSGFEFFRLRMGRRSRVEALRMRWTGEPEPVLDRLFVFGPAATDLDE